MDRKESCKWCYYFSQGFHMDGSCLKNAPVVNPNKQGLIFPRVRHNQWCGEWKEKDENN